MKVIIQTCSGREHFVKYLLKRIPNAIVNFDDFPDGGKFESTAFFNFQRGMKLAGNESLLYLEDDIILTDSFLNKIEKAKFENPNMVIQFFSMRKKDIEIGTRVENGSNYIMMQCTYFPKGVAKGIYEHSLTYWDENHTTAPNDPCVASYLQKNKMKYVIYVPNLVDHRREKSVINPRRSSNRISKTFKHV